MKKKGHACLSFILFLASVQREEKINRFLIGWYSIEDNKNKGRQRHCNIKV